MVGVDCGENTEWKSSQKVRFKKRESRVRLTLHPGSTTFLSWNCVNQATIAIVMDLR